MAARALAPPVARYIRAHRDRLIGNSQPLSQHWQRQLRPYFDGLDLTPARIVLADPWPIPNPPFVVAASRLGLQFSEPALGSGITFDTVIALRERPKPESTLSRNGSCRTISDSRRETFSRRYVSGFLANRSYDAIPLERCAFEFESRFLADPERSDVAGEVRMWIDPGLL
jgi:hypothetical protein